MYLVTQSCELLNCVPLEARSGCCSFTFVSQSQVRSSLLHILSIFPGQFGIVLHSLKWQDTQLPGSTVPKSRYTWRQEYIQEPDFLFKLNGVMPCLSTQYISLDGQRPLGGYRSRHNDLCTYNISLFCLSSPLFSLPLSRRSLDFL